MTVFYTIVLKKNLLTIMLTIVHEGSLLTIVNVGWSLTIVNERSSLTFVNKGLSLTIVTKTTKFIKTVDFGKKLHATLLNVVLHEV